MGRTATRGRASPAREARPSSAHPRVGEMGDIIEVEWYDTHSSGRMTISEVEGLEEPKTTLAFGVVIRKSCRYLTIASELCTDPLSDGTWVEQIPRGAIRSVALLGRRDLSELFEDAVSSKRSSPKR